MSGEERLLKSAAEAVLLPEMGADPLKPIDPAEQAAIDFCVDRCPFADDCPLCDYCDGDGNLSLPKKAKKRKKHGFARAER